LQEQHLSRRRERETAELKELQAIHKANEEEALREGAKQAVLSPTSRRSEHHHRRPWVVFSLLRFDTYMKRLTPHKRRNSSKKPSPKVAEPPNPGGGV